MDNVASLLDIVRCPRTKATLVRDGDRLVSTDADTRLAYPIRDDIPIMLGDEAMELTAEEWESVMSSQESSDG